MRNVAVRLSASVRENRSRPSSHTGTSSRGTHRRPQRRRRRTRARRGPRRRAGRPGPRRSGRPPRPPAAELVRNGVRPLLALVVVDDPPRALGGEGARAGGADPARGARDDDAATVEPCVHATNLVEPRQELRTSRARRGAGPRPRRPGRGRRPLSRTRPDARLGPEQPGDVAHRRAGRDPPRRLDPVGQRQAAPDRPEPAGRSSSRC